MMTLEEAIKHATEISETCNNKECSLDHKQLAEWLIELKELREGRKYIRNKVTNHPLLGNSDMNL